VSRGRIGIVSTDADLPERLQRLASGPGPQSLDHSWRPAPAPRRGRFRIVVDMPWDASAHMGTGAYSEAMVRALARSATDAELVKWSSDLSPSEPSSFRLRTHL